MSDVTVSRSSVYPGQIRVRVVGAGSGGGEILVSRQELAEIVIRGREVLEDDEPPQGAAE